MPPLARAVALLLAVAGCVLLVVAEFSTLYEIQVITVVKETTKGHENHAFALLVIALGAAFMAYGGILGGARPAQFGLVALALAALFVVLAVDYPDVNDEGFIGEAFERAKATPQTGFYLESLGAVLLLLSAVATLLLTHRDVQPRLESSETPAE
jgi:drug/metabolite transporter (DMT)-like permease